MSSLRLRHRRRDCHTVAQWQLVPQCTVTVTVMGSAALSRSQWPPASLAEPRGIIMDHKLVGPGGVQYAAARSRLLGLTDARENKLPGRPERDNLVGCGDFQALSLLHGYHTMSIKASAASTGLRTNEGCSFAAAKQTEARTQHGWEINRASTRSSVAQ